MNTFWTIVGMLAFYELGVHQIPECIERHRAWRSARRYCDQVGKPLLRIGIKRSPTEPPNGDYTLDISDEVNALPGGIQGDERNMWMIPDRAFGVCFNEHTMEHMHDPEDVQLAVNECCRVADWAIFLFPSPESLFARFHETHYLALDPVPEGIAARHIHQMGARCIAVVPNAAFEIG